jgi:hypothetical protein
LKSWTLKYLAQVTLDFHCVLGSKHSVADSVSMQQTEYILPLSKLCSLLSGDPQPRSISPTTLACSSKPSYEFLFIFLHSFQFSFLPYASKYRATWSSQTCHAPSRLPLHRMIFILECMSFYTTGKLPILKTSLTVTLQDYFLGYKC